MKYGKLVIRVSKSKTINNNNILGHDNKNKKRKLWRGAAPMLERTLKRMSSSPVVFPGLPKRLNRYTIS